MREVLQSNVRQSSFLFDFYPQQNYVKTHKFSNAEMSQLWHTFEEVAGNRVPISEVIDTWTRQMGFPVVRVSRVPGTNNYILSQRRFLINPSDVCNDTESPYGFVLLTAKNSQLSFLLINCLATAVWIRYSGDPLLRESYSVTHIKY